MVGSEEVSDAAEVINFRTPINRETRNKMLELFEKRAQEARGRLGQQLDEEGDHE